MLFYQKKVCRDSQIQPPRATREPLAERYFRDAPPTALIKLRQFAELLSELIAARNALYVGERETFALATYVLDLL
jgi:hypothetical protein